MGSSHLVEAGFKVIAISRFGYLRTPPASNMSPEAQADQFAALLDELKPHVHAKGTDYTPETIPEAAWVLSKSSSSLEKT